MPSIEDFMRAMAGQPPYTKEDVLCDMEYPEAVLEAMKECRAKHIWRLPLNDKIEAVNALFERLCQIYNITEGHLIFALEEGATTSGRSTYHTPTKTITLAGKFSMLTFLHEFAHLNGGQDELSCSKWAVNLFRKIFPVSFSRLRFQDGMFVRGENATLPRVELRGEEAED